MLRFTGLKNANGIAPVMVQMMDSGGILNGGTNLSELGNFMIVITNVNDTPTIGRVTGKTILEDGETDFIVNVNDIESAPGDLVLSVSSTNQALLPDGNITVSMGTYPTQRVVHVVPVKDMNGTTLLTFRVSDGTNSASVSTTLRVTAVNDAPSFELNENYANISAVVGQSYSQQVIASVSKGGVDEAKQLLTYVITNNKSWYICDAAEDKR